MLVCEQNTAPDIAATAAVRCNNKIFRISAKALLYPEEKRTLKDDYHPVTSVRPVKISFSRTHLIGAGCFGLVFKTRLRRVDELPSTTTTTIKSKPQSSTILALKVVAVRRRDCKELSILKSLDHANVVRLHYYFFSSYSYVDEDDEDDSSSQSSAGSSSPPLLRKELCCSMLFEFLQTTLFEVMQERVAGLEEAEAMGYFRQLMDALEYLHGMGVVHRDVKPTNLLLDETRTVLKLCDLGSAAMLSDVCNSENGGGGSNSSYVCSRFYRAPELLLACESHDGKVDVWSASCVLAEMLLGGAEMPLFPGESAMGQLVEIICVLGPISPEELVRMGAILPRIDDEVLSSRLMGTAGERLAARMPEGTSEFAVGLMARGFEYIPEMRPSAAKMLEWLEGGEDMFL